MESKVRPLLVGEANPYQADPGLAQHYALYPDPPGCAGWRLCHKIMQLEEGDYLTRFDRVNLCNGKWGMREAKNHAIQIQAESNRALVLFGARVSAAFLMKFAPYWRGYRLGQPVVILPHPSGLSRAWNEPGAFERARAVLRESGVL